MSYSSVHSLKIRLFNSVASLVAFLVNRKSRILAQNSRKILLEFQKSNFFIETFNGILICDADMKTTKY